MRRIEEKPGESQESQERELRKEPRESGKRIEERTASGFVLGGTTRLVFRFLLIILERD